MNKLRSNEMKDSKKRCQFVLKTVLKLKRRSFNNFYFEFEYRKYRTIKGNANKCHEDVKVLN
jgi:hypothetical protein